LSANPIQANKPDSTERWLVAYDIADPRRLQKVGRHMRKEGVALQYSVYLVRGNKAKIDLLLNELSALIDLRADDIRAYPLGENVRIWGMGKQFNEGDNTLSDEVLDRLRVASMETEKSWPGAQLTAKP